MGFLYEKRETKDKITLIFKTRRYLLALIASCILVGAIELWAYFFYPSPTVLMFAVFVIWGVSYTRWMSFETKPLSEDVQKYTKNGAYIKHIGKPSILNETTTTEIYKTAPKQVGARKVASKKKAK
jgi:hypothetical protein